MRKRSFSIFVMYVWSKMLVELVRNPYLAVRDIQRHRFLLPVIFSPLITLFILLVAGKIGSLLFQVYDIERSFIAFVLSIITITLILWQVLLFYLLFSFLLALRARKNS